MKNLKENIEKKVYTAPKMDILKMDCSPDFLLMVSGGETPPITPFSVYTNDAAENTTIE